MSEHKRLRVLTNIAGCFLLVTALHYVADEPTRSALIRAVFRQRTLPIHNTPDHYRHPDVVQNDQGLLHDASFERWDNLQSYPTLQAWLSSVTIGVTQVVKREAEIVQHRRSAVRLEDDGIGHCGNVRQELPLDVIPSLRGRRLKFSVWALSTTPGVPCVHIDDGTGRSSTCLQSQSGAWQPLTVERMMSPEATRALLIIDRTRDISALPVYVDNASLEESPPASEAPGTTVVTAPLPAPSSEPR